MSAWFDVEWHSVNWVSLDEYIEQGRHGFTRWTLHPSKPQLETKLRRCPNAFNRLQQLYIAIPNKDHLRTYVTLDEHQSPIIFPEIHVYTVFQSLIWGMQDGSDRYDLFLAPRLKAHASLACLSDEPLQAATVWLYEALIAAPVELQIKAQANSNQCRAVLRQLTHYN